MEKQREKNPWLGLESYKEGEVLYGRDEDIRDLSQRVLNYTDTLLYGKSGIGKSSILNAGILPAARRRGFLPVQIRLSHKDGKEYAQQIKDAIGAAIQHRIVDVVPCKDAEKESLYEYFHRHTFHDAEGERIKLLIIFDQFEEIFTLQTDEMAKKRFFAELADFLNDVMPSYLQPEIEQIAEPKEKITITSDNFNDIFDTFDLEDNIYLPDYVTDNDIHLVFTIREDFLSEFEYYSASIPSLKQNRYGLRPINEEQASQIILRPMPGLINMDVAKLIIEKVTNRTDFELDGCPEIEVDSAVLSLYLNRLYDAKTGNTITAELVEQKGGEIIADFYADAISDISESTIEYLEDMLLNGQGRRDNITIYDAQKEGGVTDEELNILCNKKKILRQFNYAGDLRIEYVHDILCPVVKAHKEERLMVKQQEEERRRQEEEKQKILLEEKAKREQIEREAEEEKARMQAEAQRIKRRNRHRLYAVSAFLLILMAGFAFYLWYYEWEHESYYAQFERVNGWPVGVGEELSLEERHRTPLYYKLSHKGHLDHETDIEVCSSNGALPLSPRIAVLEVNENDVDDAKAWAYHEMLSKIAYIHFVEGENGKIDKEIAMDANKNTLFVISYFHLPNGKEAWAQFVTSTGQALQIRNNKIDRMRLSWHVTEGNVSDPNNGRIESLSYFDADGVCRPAANGICGYAMRFKDSHTTMRYFVDEYGRTTQTPYNVVISKISNDTTEVRYGKASSLNDSVPQMAYGPKGYSKEVTVGDISYLYTNAKDYVATLTTARDSKGNKVKEQTEGLQPVAYPALTMYAYSEQGYLTGIEKYGQNGKPFCTANDSIYKKQWTYSAEGEVVLEEHWNVLNDRVFSHRITEKGNVKTDELIDKAKDFYLTRIDSTMSNGTVTCYYGKNNKPVTFKVVDEDTDTLEYHKIVVNEEKGVRVSLYYTLDKKSRIIPCPTRLDQYGKALSFYRKEEGFDDDGNKIYYRLLDENDVIIKSMMWYYQNGQSVARAAMGVEGYGHPVRCPEWEEEGFAYYKIYYSKNFNDEYISINAVDEWEKPSIFYDKSVRSYQIITYRDYKGATLGKTTNLSGTSLPYLHILSKESGLYRIGLRDGDRIVELGVWKQGMPQPMLKKEWEKMYKEKMKISVLRPMASTYKRVTTQVALDKEGCEEYHTYLLTVPELNMIRFLP